MSGPQYSPQKSAPSHVNYLELSLAELRGDVKVMRSEFHNHMLQDEKTFLEIKERTGSIAEGQRLLLKAVIATAVASSLISNPKVASLIGSML